MRKTLIIKPIWQVKNVMIE